MEGLDQFEVSYPSTEENGGNSKFTPVPEGLYAVEVGDVRFKQHKRGPLFGLRLNIIEGENKGRIVWTNIIFLPYYTDATKKKVTPGAGIARNFLKAIGQQYKGEKLKVNPQAWLGQQLGVRVTVKGDRNDVRNFYNGADYTKAVEKAKNVEALPEEAIF